MANLVYNYYKQALLVGSFNHQASNNTPPIWIALVSNSYSPDGDTHVYRSSLTNVVAASGLSNGGMFALSSPLVTTNATTNQGVLDGSDILLANITFGTTVRAAVLFGSTAAGSASDPLIAYVDFSTDQAVTAGTFQITWASGGILAVT